ncbi:MAG: ferrochelatase [Desulfurellaceae bacterium]|nr:ferrochelatase [Desulfurellaceae bacterium]
MGKRAIVLLSFGGPKNEKETRKFLFNLFFDRHIIHFPSILRLPAAIFLSSLRFSEAKKHYALIGGSPLIDNVEKQANLLRQRIKDDVFMCMRYSKPRAKEVVKKIKEKDIKNVILFPLYPHYSKTTVGSSIDDFLHQIKKQNFNTNIRVISHWYKEKNFINIIKNLIYEEWEKIPDDLKAYSIIIFSAHSLPQKIIKNGDPYLQELKDCVNLIMKNMPLDHVLSFQSKATPVKWLEPSTEEVIKQSVNIGKKAIIIVPISFVSEHIETLFEIDIMYRDLAWGQGVKYFSRIPTDFTCSEFIDFMEEMIND